MAIVWLKYESTVEDGAYLLKKKQICMFESKRFMKTASNIPTLANYLVLHIFFLI